MCSLSSSDVGRQQACRFVRDDVARAAGFHRGGRDAERARFEQHAAQRLGAVRREEQHRRVREPRQRVFARQPAGEAHVAARRLRGRFRFRAAGTVADDDDRPGEIGGVDRRNQLVAAFVGREFADVDRVGTADVGRHGLRGGADALDVDRVRNEFEARAREFGRAGAEVAGDRAADGDHGAGFAERAAAPFEIARHVGNGGARDRREAFRARADARQHHAGRARRAERIGVVVVDQVGPVADRPVVADRHDDRHVHPARGANRSGRRQQVLAVDDVDVFVADERLEVRAERALEAFVLEVVADERQAGRVAAEFADGEILVTACVFRRSAGPGAAGRW